MKWEYNKNLYEVMNEAAILARLKDSREQAGQVRYREADSVIADIRKYVELVEKTDI